MIISSSCRTGKIQLTGNRYILLAEHILLAFILTFMANSRLCCWLFHVPFMVRNNLMNVGMPVLYLLSTAAGTVELMVLIFWAFVFSSSLKAAKLTNRLQTNVMRLSSLPASALSQGRKGVPTIQRYKPGSQ